MRHLNRVVKLNKPKSHRKAIFQNLANALLKHERITTTVTKAMELRRVADRLVTLAKRKDLHSQRLAFDFLRDKETVKKLFTDIGDRYTAINGGYTRVLKIGNRKGDNAPMAMIELTQRKEQEKKKKETGKETKKEAEGKKEPKAKEETKEKKETKAKKEPKVKKEAKSENKEVKEPKEKKPRKKKEEAKEEATE